MKIREKFGSFGWLLGFTFLLIILSILCASIDNIFFKVCAVFLGLLVLVLIHLFSNKIEEEDRKEEIPTNKVSVMGMGMGILYVLAGLGIITTQFADGSWRDAFSWLQIEFGVFLFYIGWKHNQTGEELNSNLKELRRLRAILKELEEEQSQD